MKYSIIYYEYYVLSISQEYRFPSMHQFPSWAPGIRPWRFGLVCTYKQDPSEANYPQNWFDLVQIALNWFVLLFGLV